MLTNPCFSQVDLSLSLLPIADECCRRFHFHPKQSLAEGRAQLVWASQTPGPVPFPDQPTPGFNREQTVRQLCAEFLAQQIILASPDPVHFCLGRRKPEGLPWIDISGRLARLADPEASDARELQESYRHSGLFVFHRHYYGEEPHLKGRWHETYTAIDTGQFPACISSFFREDYSGWEDDQGVLHFTRGMLSLGWHPRHIAGILASRLGPTEAAWRQADFAVRCSAGLIHERIDRLQNFDCESVCKLGFCPPSPSCPVGLAEMKTHLRTGSWQP